MRYEIELRGQEIEEKGWVIECFKCRENVKTLDLTVEYVQLEAYI